MARTGVMDDLGGVLVAPLASLAVALLVPAALVLAVAVMVATSPES